MISTGWKPSRLTLASLEPGPEPKTISSAESAKLASSGTKLKRPVRRSKSSSAAAAISTQPSAAPWAKSANSN